jgi:hypothetical protein
MLGFGLLTILVLLWFAMIPVWPYSRRWGFYPSGAAFLALVLLILMIWFGVLTLRFPWGAYGAI